MAPDLFAYTFILSPFYGMLRITGLMHIPTSKRPSLTCASAEADQGTIVETWSRGYKTFFVLNSVEHEILNAHKYKNIKKFGLFKAQLSLECYFPRSYMLKCQQLLAF